MIMYSILGLAGTLAAMSYLHDRRTIAKEKAAKERTDKIFQKYFETGEW